MTTDDIMNRLRRVGEKYDCNCLICDAADEIELLRSTVTDCRIEIERLTAERDEARRALIILLAGTDIAAMHRLATERGWDCFKEADDGSW